MAHHADRAQVLTLTLTLTLTLNPNPSPNPNLNPDPNPIPNPNPTPNQVMADAAEYGTLSAAGCLINADLGGKAIDPTPKACRELIWTQFLRPRYYEQGVSAFWLDETDGEGTGVKP